MTIYPVLFLGKQMKEGFELALLSSEPSVMTSKPTSHRVKNFYEITMVKDTLLSDPFSPGFGLAAFNLVTTV